MILCVPFKPYGKPLVWHRIDEDRLYLTICKRWVPKKVTTYKGPGPLPEPACPICASSKVEEFGDA